MTTHSVFFMGFGPDAPRFKASPFRAVLVQVRTRGGFAIL